MKVLLITHGEQLDAARIASGNSVRAHAIERGLAEAGIQVVHVYPEALGAPSDPGPDPRIGARVYRDRVDLAALIEEESPDVLILGYWELIELLPDTLAQPIVLDVVAPRILEAMYQEHLDLASEVRRTLACYRRADRFLVGNRRQASFLIAWLILAGFDCRGSAPVDILPISVEDAREDPVACRPGERLRLVSGGVSWPWRRTEAWFDSLVDALGRHGNEAAELVLFSGNYVYAAEPQVPDLGPRERAWPETLVKRRGLLPYGEMRDYLRRECHVGVELADENPERWHSQSFRAMEFLCNGLPLICNGYTELAELVRAHDAGWVVERPDELDAVIGAILDRPELVAAKSANALRLVGEHFHYATTIQPLLAFLSEPCKASLGRPLVSLNPLAASVEVGSALATAPQPNAAVEPLGSPTPVLAASIISSIARVMRLGARSALKPVVKGVARGIGRLGRTSAVILVSRSDIRPANHGAAVKIDRTAWGLSFAVEAVYLLSEDRASYHEVRKGQFRERAFPRWLRAIGPDPARVRAFLIASGIPADDAFLYIPVGDWSFIVRTLYLAIKTGARTYQAEFPAYGRATVWARDLLGGRALLVEHNVEYRRIADQMPGLPRHGYEMLRKVELGWCNRSDAVITVSEADRQRLLDDGVDPRRLHVIPHGVDLDQFARAAPLDLHALFGIPRERAILVYHGIYLYPPNLEAMEVMASEILPRLDSLGVKATLLAIGARPPASALHPHLIFTGPVESVAPYLKGADLAVVPLQKGGGTRMKILDYFAAGLAVVSTEKGAEGIPIESGVHALIVADHDQFARAVAGLLADPARRGRIGAAAQAFVAPLDWRAIAARYLELV